MDRRSVVALALALSSVACFRIRGGDGGGEDVTVRSARAAGTANVHLPAGYALEVVAKGLDFPTGVTFDAAGRVYVIESGYSYGEVFRMARLVRIEPGGTTTEIARSDNGPWNGVAFHDGAFFVAEGGVKRGGRILRIEPDGRTTPLVEDLPSKGVHHTNGPAIGPDGMLYFGQGTATNSAVVGEDNADQGWLKREPKFHDVPCKDITLTGQNYESKNPLAPGSDQKVVTGAFLPFGTPSEKGQVIKGAVPCSGAVMKVSPKGGGLELVAWGFRNPFGLAFAPDGKLYVTDNGFDLAGSRPIWGGADHLFEVKSGAWYGWPDFAGGLAVDHRRMKPPGKDPARQLIAEPPGKAESALAYFGCHSSSDGLDFSRNAAFGHVGEAFVAQFGDMAPFTGKVLDPVGFKVVRVDPRTGVIRDFATNAGKQNGPASKLGHEGLERPVAVRFDPAGTALYVVDFGVMTVTEKGQSPRPQTGVLWRIVRSGR